MSNSIAPGSSADINIKVTALTTNPNVPVTYKTIILKKNLVNGVNTLTQEMMSAQNTKYVIKYDYVLGEDITVPASCVLEFDGGKIDGVDANNKRKLIGNRTTIVGVNNRPIFGDNMLPLEGMFNNDTLYPEWFGIFPNADSDYTYRWNRIIESSTNTNTKIAVNAGTYKFYNPIVLHENTSIVGSETRPVFLFMPNDPNSELRFLTLLGTKITLKNIVIERPTNLRHTSAGIILGDVTNHIVAARCTIENVTVTRFYSGLVFDYTWLVHLNNIESNYNVLGIIAKGTETFIEGLMLEHNVVGLHTIKMDDSNENNVKIVNATIESNGIGAIIQSGYVSILNTYMEGNYPTEGVDGNEALNYSGLIGEYTSGADIVCGKTAEFVQALHIINCYVGHSKNFPSIFDIDKCYNFNIIGTKVENLKTTANTNIGLVNSITSAQFSSQRYDYLRPSCGINYKLSNLPIVDIRDFSKSTVDSNNRFILNYGICFQPTDCSQLVDNEKYYAYTSAVTSNASIKINIEGNHVPTKNCTLSLLLRIAKNVKTLEIDFFAANGSTVKKYIDNDKEYYDGNLKQLNIFIPGYNNAIYATLKWSNTNEDYVAGDKENSILIEGLFVYNGVVENMTFVNEYPHYLTRSKMVDAEAALVIPNSTPSTHTYDVKNIGRPCLYYNQTSDKLVLRVGNIDKTISFD